METLTNLFNCLSKFLSSLICGSKSHQLPNFELEWLSCPKLTRRLCHAPPVNSIAMHFNLSLSLGKNYSSLFPDGIEYFVFSSDGILSFSGGISMVRRRRSGCWFITLPSACHRASIVLSSDSSKNKKSSSICYRHGHGHGHGQWSWPWRICHHRHLSAGTEVGVISRLSGWRENGES